MEPDVTDAMIVALTTCPPDQAAALAETLVEQGHAACVNILPGVQSVYRWQGTVVRDNESLLVMKTTAAHADRLKAAILEAHSYDVPEFVVLTVESGHAPYIRWVVESVS